MDYPKPHAFVFNGPPGCGKDTAHNVDLRTLPANRIYMRTRFSLPLKEGVKSIYGLSTADAHFLEKNKEIKHELLLNETYRKAQIALFHHLAMEHGQDILGKLLVKRIDKDWLLDKDDLVILCPDGGRDPEIRPLLDHFNVHIVQIMRDGTSFEGDIRGYIEPEHCTVTQIENNGTIDELHERVRSYITAVLANENN